MRKGALHHGHDILAGVSIIIITWVLVGLYGSAIGETSKVTSVREAELSLDTARLLTPFLHTTLKEFDATKYLTGEETYGDLLFLYVQDSEHKDVYYAAFTQGLHAYMQSYTGSPIGGYTLTFPNGDVKSFGTVSPFPIEYSIPSTTDKPIILKIVSGVA